MERIVLGYSGGLETSIAIPWLAERLGVEVITVTLDLGQGRDLADIRERALSGGALRAHVLDVRDEFARDYILPALQAGAMEKDGQRLAAALARPLIVRKLIEIARMERATAIAHCCEPDSEDELRFERLAQTLDSSVGLIAVLRESRMSPSERIAFAKERGIFVSPPNGETVADANLWGRSVEIDADQHPDNQGRDELYVLTRAPQVCPDEPAYLDVEIEDGVPVRVNGIEMPLVELIESVETIAGAHGVGRHQNDRHIHEGPAGVVLQMAHRALEKAAIPADLDRLKQKLSREYAGLVHKGLWFTPTRDAIAAFAGVTERSVTGSVRLELFKGRCRTVGYVIKSSTLASVNRSAAPVGATLSSEDR